MSASTALAPFAELQDEERLFFDTVLAFARTRIAPKVREMDETGHFDSSLVPALFELGVMGVEIPSEYGGSGSSFFNAVLAVQALARVDPSVAVLVDVQKHVGRERAPALGQRRTEGALLLEARQRVGRARTRSVKRAPARMPSRSKRAPRSAVIVTCCVAASCGSPTPARARCSSCSPTWTRTRATRASPRSWSSALCRLSVGKKEDKLGIRASSTCELCSTTAKCPRRTCSVKSARATRSRSKR